MPLNRDGAVGCQDLGTVGDFYLAFYLVGDYILYIYIYICDIIEIIYIYIDAHFNINLGCHDSD